MKTSPGTHIKLTRRQTLQLLGGAMAALMLPTGRLLAEPAPILTKPIPGAEDELPATTRVEHMTENMQAGRGPMPSAETRQRMVRFIESL